MGKVGSDGADRLLAAGVVWLFLSMFPQVLLPCGAFAAPCGKNSGEYACADTLGRMVRDTCRRAESIYGAPDRTGPEVGLDEALAIADDEGLLRNARELVEYYDDLRHNPLNINSAGRHDLRRLMLLTDFQIASLLGYISEHGAILSFAELSLLHGFNEQTANSLRPYVYFGDTGRKGFSGSVRSEVYTRYVLQEEEDGDSFSDSFLTKCKVDFPGRGSAFLITGKDAGERFGDYTSGSVSVYDISPGKSSRGGIKADVIVAGDISARFGQGLTLRNSPAFAGGEEAAGYCKRGAALASYTSSDECRGLRGVGATLSYRAVSFTALYSCRGVDATLNEDGSYRSLKYDGLHNTELLLSARNSTKESVCGFRGECLFKKMKIGASYVGYMFNRHNGSAVNYYNANQYYDGYNSNAAVDIYASGGNTIIFAEGAISSCSGGYALLGGASCFYKGWNFHFLGRLYSGNYIAPHAGAYSTISDVCNQRGVSFAATGALWNNLHLGACGEYTFYPCCRYGIKASSSVLKAYIRVFRSSFYDANTASFKVMFKQTAEFYSKVKYSRRVDFIYSGRWQPGRYSGISAKAQYSLCGATDMRGVSSAFACQAAASLGLCGGRIKLYAGITCYDVGDWKTRMYFREYSLPQTFSSSLLYGSGANLYCMLNLKITRHLSFYLKTDRSRGRQAFRSALRYKI